MKLVVVFYESFRFLIKLENMFFNIVLRFVY